MTRQHRTYSEIEIDQALVLSEVVGVAETCRRLGIPEQTLRQWRYQLRRAEMSTAERIEYRRRLMDELSARFLEVIKELLDEICAKVESPTATLKDMAHALDVIVDKMLLLEGLPTSRDPRKS